MMFVKRDKRQKSKATNVISNIVAYDIFQIIMFVTYDVCCIIGFVPYDVCRLIGFVAYEVCRIMMFAANYDVCRLESFSQYHFLVQSIFLKLYCSKLGIRW